jgi:hypothetical protein
MVVSAGIGSGHGKTVLTSFNIETEAHSQRRRTQSVVSARKGRPRAHGPLPKRSRERPRNSWMGRRRVRVSYSTDRPDEPADPASIRRSDWGAVGVEPAFYTFCTRAVLGKGGESFLSSVSRRLLSDARAGKPGRLPGGEPRRRKGPRRADKSWSPGCPCGSSCCTPLTDAAGARGSVSGFRPGCRPRRECTTPLVQHPNFGHPPAPLSTHPPRGR